MIDKTPSSFEYSLLLFPSALELTIKKILNMNKLIIDAVNKDIFLMIIGSDYIYNISHENSKTNYEKLMILINDFLNSKNLNLTDISSLYVNKGPGSFAGIRNSLSTVKAIQLVKKIDYYCYSFEDFKFEDKIKHENIPNLCDKFKVKKKFD
jgi:tRNA A37 threonylcarbamoyladenosine modification protein TsaB